MRTLINILLTITVITLVSCETAISYENIDDQEQIVLNSIAATDTTLSVYLSKSQRLQNLSELILPEKYWYEWVHSGLSDFKDITTESNINIESVDRAKVYVNVNSNTELIMTYRPETRSYVCDYTPSTSDNIDLRIECEGFPTVKAQAIVPKSQKCEVLSHEKFYSKNPISTDKPYDGAGSDTVVRVKLKIIDPEGERNYYRLRVFNSGVSRDGKKVSTDVFTSSDFIFVDNQIANDFGLWEKGFSNVFDDSLIDGEEYVLTLDSRLRDCESRVLTIELQSITADTYYYLKTVSWYLTSEGDVYTEPIQIFSNTNTGLGIFSASNSTKCIIYL